MTGDCHVRFYESLGVRFPRATHHGALSYASASSGHRRSSSTQKIAVPSSSPSGDCNANTSPSSVATRRNVHATATAGGWRATS